MEALLLQFITTYAPTFILGLGAFVGISIMFWDKFGNGLKYIFSVLNTPNKIKDINKDMEDLRQKMYQQKDETTAKIHKVEETLRDNAHNTQLIANQLANIHSSIENQSERLDKIFELMIKKD